MNRNSAELYQGINFQFRPCGKTPYCHSQKESAYILYEARAVNTALHPRALHRK